jgi:Domain of unknown function (DUF4326)
MREQPKRIQRRRVKGWTLPPNTVYVGRETQWGHRWMPGQFWWAEDYARVIVEVYRNSLIGRLRANPTLLESLRGKNLACWCSLDQPCHADVLLEFANQHTATTMPDAVPSEMPPT